MDEVKFPYYSGNINLVKVLGHITINRFIHAHKYPSKNTLEAISKVKNAKTPEEKRLAKQALYSFTPSCFIEKGEKRQYANIKYYTGLMQIDLDGINNHEIATELKQWLYEQPECICAYFSPSGNVKGLIRIDNPRDKNHYIRLFNSVAEKYEETGFMDSATKNAVLPLFLSADPLILYKKFNEVEPWIKEKEIVVEYKELNNAPPTSKNATNNNWRDENYELKTIRILSNKIKNINNNGHPQVRSAALILGSRVAAGYISEINAKSTITELIKINSYLQKGVNGYIKTAEWGILEGMKNPKYY